MFFTTREIKHGESVCFHKMPQIKCKIKKRGGHGKLRNRHGKVMEKYFVKSVGTLLYVLKLFSNVPRHDIEQICFWIKFTFTDK